MSFAKKAISKVTGASSQEKAAREAQKARIEEEQKKKKAMQLEKELEEAEKQQQMRRANTELTRGTARGNVFSGGSTGSQLV